MAAVAEQQPEQPAQYSDVQSGVDTRALALKRVGVRGVRLPMRFLDGADGVSTIGDWRCYTDLPADARGTHMSRLVRALHKGCDPFSFDSFARLPAEVLKLLPGAAECDLSVRFDCFIDKKAPVTGESGFVDYRAMFAARRRRDGSQRLIIGATAPVTSLCPCSKAISDRGAHNQRSHLTLYFEPGAPARMRDVIALIESCASCELYSMLKRADERHVTERAFDNPKFVEDMVRDLAGSVGREVGALSYRVEAENFESIHNHSAFAMVESPDFPADMVD